MKRCEAKKHAEWPRRQVQIHNQKGIRLLKQKRKIGAGKRRGK